jgi:predicted dehydrogenase
VHANRTAVITLHGTEAHAWSEADGTQLFLARRGQERAPVPLTAIDPVVEELAEFAQCVRAGKEPEVGGEEASENIAVLEAIVESAQSGRAVHLDGTGRERARGR